MDGSIFKFSKSIMEELSQRIINLGNVPLEPVVGDNIYFKCGDNTCSQSCHGGCGTDCYAAMSDCLLRL